MRKMAILLAWLIAVTATNAQLVYVECCTQQRPDVDLFLACMGNGGPNKQGVSSLPWWWDGKWPASCIYGFADSSYSTEMMAIMCVDNAPPLPEPPTVCSSWLDTAHEIAMTCGGVSASLICIELFDFDADGDVDLLDYAHYQNGFEDLRPLS